jgi:hypothetical protein
MSIVIMKIQEHFEKFPLNPKALIFFLFFFLSGTISWIGGIKIFLPTLRCAYKTDKWLNHKSYPFCAISALRYFISLNSLDQLFTSSIPIPIVQSLG